MIVDEGWSRDGAVATDGGGDGSSDDELDWDEKEDGGFLLLILCL